MSTPAYAVAVLTDVEPGPAITEYLARIDATLDLYGGQFLVHGGAAEPPEGKWAGLPIVIQYPDQNAAHAWYQSSEYQEILPLRLNHSQGIAAILPACPTAPGRRHPRRTATRPSRRARDMSPASPVAPQKEQHPTSLRKDAKPDGVAQRRSGTAKLARRWPGGPFLASFPLHFYSSDSSAGVAQETPPFSCLHPRVRQGHSARTPRRGRAQPAGGPTPARPDHEASAAGGPTPPAPFSPAATSEAAGQGAQSEFVPTVDRPTSHISQPRLSTALGIIRPSLVPAAINTNHPY